MFRRIKYSLLHGYFFFLVYLLFSSVGVCCAASADSSMYYHLRDSLVAVLPENAPTVQTADVLAGEGLFNEAITILSTMAVSVPSDTTDSTALRPVSEWRRQLSTGTDYFHLEDVDTVEKTEEEMRDYKRLTETPLSIWSRFRLSGELSGQYVKRFSPEVYLSNYRTAVSLPLQCSLKSRGAVELLLKLGKWFQPDAQDTNTFAPFTLQPSDMVGGGITFSPGYDGNGFGSLSRYIALPLSIDIEQYRKDRSGYESFVRYMASPSVQIRFGNENRSLLRVNSDIRYDDYTNEESNYLDILQVYTAIEHSFRGSRISHRSRGIWFSDYYPDRNTPSMINRCQLSYNTSYRLSSGISFLLDADFIYENEKNRDTVTYCVSGTQNKVALSSRISAINMITFEPLLQWEYRRATSPKHQRFVWRGFTAWEPMIRLHFQKESIELMMQGSYFHEDIHQVFEAFYNDNHNVRIVSEISILIGKLLTVAAQAEYHYREYENTSRRTENLSLSGTASVHW